MANLEVRPLTETEYPLWDDFVEQSPQGCLFHKTFWLKATGRRFSICGVFQGGSLCAGMVMPYVTLLGMKAAVNPPLTPYLGPLFRATETKYVNRISEQKEINREFARRLKAEFGSVMIGLYPGEVDLQPFIWEGFATTVNYTYVVPLGQSIEEIWTGMEDKRRNDIRKAERDGISVKINDDFERVVGLAEKTFDRQKMVVAFRSTAVSINNALRARNQCASFVAIDKSGAPIGMTFIVWDKKRSYYLLGGYDSAKKHHGASALAMWRAIQFSKSELGLKEFDFEGSMAPQIEQFFRKFGGTLTPCYHLAWRQPFMPPPGLTRIGVKLLRGLIK